MAASPQVVATPGEAGRASDFRGRTLIGRALEATPPNAADLNLVRDAERSLRRMPGTEAVAAVDHRQRRTRCRSVQGPFGVNLDAGTELAAIAEEEAGQAVRDAPPNAILGP